MSCDVTWRILDIEVDESSEVLERLEMAARRPNALLYPMAVQKYSLREAKKADSIARQIPQLTMYHLVTSPGTFISPHLSQFTTVLAAFWHT